MFVYNHLSTIFQLYHGSRFIQNIWTKKPTNLTWQYAFKSID